MIWHCGDCHIEKQSDPLSHDDTGGSVRVYGPDCPECGCRMDYVYEQLANEDHGPLCFGLCCLAKSGPIRDEGTETTQEQEA